MKIIGLDVGEKRIGVAVADAAVRIAIPDSTVIADGNELEQIYQIAKSYRTLLFVIGLPRNVAGQETAQSQYVRHFATSLQDYIPEAKVKFQDETLTSVEAERRLRERKRSYDKSEIDSEAASIILQDFIENFTSEMAASAPQLEHKSRIKPNKRQKGLGTALGVASANATRKANQNKGKKFLGVKLPSAKTATKVATNTAVTYAKTSAEASLATPGAKIAASTATGIASEAKHLTSRPTSVTKTTPKVAVSNLGSVTTGIKSATAGLSSTPVALPQKASPAPGDHTSTTAKAAHSTLDTLKSDSRRSSASNTATSSRLRRTTPSRARRSHLSAASASQYVGELDAPSRASERLNTANLTTRSTNMPQNTKTTTSTNSHLASATPSSKSIKTKTSTSVKPSVSSYSTPLSTSSASLNSPYTNSSPRARASTSSAKSSLNPSISPTTRSYPTRATTPNSVARTAPASLKTTQNHISPSTSTQNRTPSSTPAQNHTSTATVSSTTSNSHYKSPSAAPSEPSEAPSSEKPSSDPTNSATPPKKAKKPHKIWAIALFIFLFVIVATACLCFLGYGWYNDSLTPVTRVPSCQNSSEEACKEIQFTIEDGESSKQIADNLEAAGIIRNSLAFQLYLKFQNRENDLKSGTYSLNKTFSVQDLVEMLVVGPSSEDSNVFRITFLPGDTIAAVKQKLINKGYTKEVVDTAFAKNYDHPVLVDKPEDASLEGYIYGETYEFYKGESVENIIRTALDQLYKVVQDNDLISAYKAQDLNLYQGITLASIVQKEASSNEQPTVAQVFLTRLKQGMALGSDVTVQYALDLVDPERTTYTDNASALTIDSTYNTRKYTGLPPGPISNPGQSALLAVAHPSSTNYIYFLTGDDGLMYYSSTEYEHQQNIRKYCQELCDVQL